MSNDELVTLHLVVPMNIEPPPEKVVLGRFDKVLRSVGAPQVVKVRPRMITAVAQTKYKTRSGLPVSVVGLHGKDELLVVGPAWAIERLANGKTSPELTVPRSHLEVLEAARHFAIAEIYWLALLPDLLALCGATEPKAEKFLISDEMVLRSAGENPSFKRDPEWDSFNREIASAPPCGRDLAIKLMRAMFRCSERCLVDYFKAYDVMAFAGEHIAETGAHYQRIVHMIADEGDPHPAWWIQWESKTAAQEIDNRDYFCTLSGRNISAYIVSENFEKLNIATPRSYDMHERWKELQK